MFIWYLKNLKPVFLYFYILKKWNNFQITFLFDRHVLSLIYEVSCEIVYELIKSCDDIRQIKGIGFGNINFRFWVHRLQHSRTALMQRGPLHKTWVQRDSTSSVMILTSNLSETRITHGITITLLFLMRLCLFPWCRYTQKKCHCICNHIIHLRKKKQDFFLIHGRVNK